MYDRDSEKNNEFSRVRSGEGNLFCYAINVNKLLTSLNVERSCVSARKNTAADKYTS